MCILDRMYHAHVYVDMINNQNNNNDSNNKKNTIPNTNN